MQTKLEELIDLSGEHDKLCETLTHHELVRIAGGFGATDESVAKILRDAMIHDTTTTTSTSTKQQQSQHRTENDDDDNEDIEAEGRHALQDIVNEGLAASGKFSNRNNEICCRYGTPFVFSTITAVNIVATNSTPYLLITD